MLEFLSFISVARHGPLNGVSFMYDCSYFDYCPFHITSGADINIRMNTDELAWTLVSDMSIRFYTASQILKM